MRIHLLSDLHLEFGRFEPTLMDADVVLCGFHGDPDTFLAGSYAGFLTTIAVTQGAMRHSVSVVVPHCDMHGLSHTHSATHRSCSSDTPCISHHSSATPASCRWRQFECPLRR